MASLTHDRFLDVDGVRVHWIEAGQASERLHRNGIVQALLGSAGAQSAYESALGDLGFGTPRAVEALVKKTPPQK